MIFPLGRATYEYTLVSYVAEKCLFDVLLWYLLLSVLRIEKINMLGGFMGGLEVTLKPTVV